MARPLSLTRVLYFRIVTSVQIFTGKKISSTDEFSNTPGECWLTGMTTCGFQLRLPNSYKLIIQIHRGSFVLGKKYTGLVCEANSGRPLRNAVEMIE